MAESRILKGELSRVHRSGMLFTFQPALRVLQQAHKHSYSLQLYSSSHSTSTALPSIGFISCFRLLLLLLLLLFLSARGFLQSTVQPHQSTKLTLERALATSKWHTLLIYSGCCHWKWKCKPINNCS